MLIAGTWTALLLYIISGISGIYFSTREKPSESLLLKWLAVAAMRTAWCIHTVTLLGLLWSKAVWPETFVSDILNVLAWCSMVVVQALPERLLSLVNPFIIRLFAILLLGLSLIISQRQVIQYFTTANFSLSGTPSQNKIIDVNYDSLSCTWHSGSYQLARISLGLSGFEYWHFAWNHY